MHSPVREDVVSDTIREAASDLSRKHVLERLSDWRKRVHSLYTRIESKLRPVGFIVDRSGKHRNNLEEPAQRFAITDAEFKPVDILRIERPAGTLRAMIQPRALWMIGANGALWLTIFDGHGHRTLFEVLDTARPLKEPARWVISPVGNPRDRKPLTPERVLDLLQ